MYYRVVSTKLCLYMDPKLNETCGPNRVWPNNLASFESKPLLLLQASEFFQDGHLVKVLCGILGERLFSTDAAATNHSTEQPSAKAPRLHPVRRCIHT